MELNVLLLREVISEVVENLLPLVLDFLPTVRAEERRTLILDGLRAERVLVIEIGELEFSDGFNCGKAKR